MTDYVFSGNLIPSYPSQPRGNRPSHWHRMPSGICRLSVSEAFIAAQRSRNRLDSELLREVAKWWLAGLAESPSTLSYLWWPTWVYSTIPTWTHASSNLPEKTRHKNRGYRRSKLSRIGKKNIQKEKAKRIKVKKKNPCPYFIYSLILPVTVSLSQRLQYFV